MDRQKYVVTGVHVEHRGDPKRQRVVRLCGENGLKKTVREVVDMIDKKEAEFFVVVPGEPWTKVPLHTVHPTDGREPYVSTSPDELKENNLLQVKDGCPE
jgi:hypothetical protein